MKKQLILLSLVSSMLLADTFINPLPSSVRSIDNGGVKQAIDAYKDGIGAELVDKPGIAVDNSAMNTLALKYGSDAKINNTTIVDQVMNGNGTAADKIIAGKLTQDGTGCNDGNAGTTGETWLNGSCQGGIIIAVEGAACNDLNPLTGNDKYVSGICIGTVLTNGVECNDNNPNTDYSIIFNGSCLVSARPTDLAGVTPLGKIYSACYSPVSYAIAKNECVSKGMSLVPLVESSTLATMIEYSSGKAITTKRENGVPNCISSTYIWTLDAPSSQWGALGYSKIFVLDLRPDTNNLGYRCFK